MSFNPLIPEEPTIRILKTRPETVCGICREEKESTKWFDSWENYVCAECDQIMDEGYKECYPEE